MDPLPRWILVAATVLLFVVWSNSFIAVSYVVGSDLAPAQLDWLSLTVARFVPAGAICALYCLGFRARESLAIVRAHGPRLLVCGFLAVPGYNSALYYGQQHGVPAPVASLTTTLVPLFVMILAAVFLAERLTARKVAGFAVAATGMVLVGLARSDGSAATYPLLVAITAAAPFCWSIYTVISKPLTARVSPLLWTFLATALGTLMVLPLLPGRVWRQCAALDAAGWAAVLYLAGPCTVLGFVIWTWLLQHLPASSVGFAVFLNPPLTTLSKYGLAAALPATFAFTIVRQEWIGGGLALAGMAIALRPLRRPGGLRT